MSTNDALQIWQILEHFGVPALLAVPTVLFLFSYARREKRRASDSECPPWLYSTKKSIIEHVDSRFDKLERKIYNELKDHESDYKERSLRQQRIENMLSELKGYFARGEHR